MRNSEHGCYLQVTILCHLFVYEIAENVHFGPQISRKSSPLYLTIDNLNTFKPNASFKIIIILDILSGEPQDRFDRLRRVGEDVQVVQAQADHRRSFLLLTQPRLRKIPKNC